MSVISGIKPVANKVFHYGIERPLKSFANLGILKSHSDKYVHNSTRYIAGFGVMSIVLKDALGCYYYVTQSLNNKKIPEDKRKFVAALDLANGVLMNITQLGMFFTISNKKVQKKIFDKLYGKIFTRSMKRAEVNKLLKIDKFKPLKRLGAGTVFDNLKSSCRESFGVLTALVASTIVAKRMIVPFIATPTADWAKAKFIDNNPGNNEAVKNWQPPQALSLQEPVKFACGKNASALYTKIKTQQF